MSTQQHQIDLSSAKEIGEEFHQKAKELFAKYYKTSSRYDMDLGRAINVKKKKLESLADSMIYSTLDLTSEFWQVEMAEEYKPYTAFTYGPLGFIECETMPYGTTNPPTTFCCSQRWPNCEARQISTLFSCHDTEQTYRNLSEKNYDFTI